MLQTALNYGGIAVFASSVAMVAIRKGFDLFGIAALGVLIGLAFHWSLPTGPRDLIVGSDS